MRSLDDLTIGHIYEINGTKGVVVMIPKINEKGFLVREGGDPMCYQIENGRFVEYSFFDHLVGDKILERRGM